VAAGPAGPSIVTPAEPVEAALQPGASHRYRVALAAGQYLRVDVEQRGIDVILRVTAPEGAPLAEVDGPHGRQGAETLLLLPETGGDFGIEVASLDRQAPAGRYELRIAELRPAVPDDRRRVAADRLQAAAHRSMAAGTRSEIETARGRFREALGTWRALGERGREAEALVGIGTAQRLLGQPAEVLAGLEEARRLCRELGDTRGEGEALHQIGLAHWARGDGREALDAFAAALALWRQLGDAGQQATALNNLGLLHSSSGRLREALDAYGKALELFRQEGDRKRQAIALTNIGTVDDLLGEPAAALESHRSALEIARSLGDVRRQAGCLNNIASVQAGLGAAQEALDSYEAALPLFRAAGDASGEAQTLGNLAELYRLLGQPERTVELSRRALAIQRRSGDRRGEASALATSARGLRDLGSTVSALAALREALDLYRAAGDRVGEAETLTDQGALEAVGDAERGLAALHRAVTLQRDLGNRSGEARALFQIGRVESKRGARMEARAALEPALAIRRELGDRRGQESALRELARLDRAEGRLDAARARMDEALELLETLRTAVLDDELRLSWFASVRAAYELQISILMDLERQRPGEGFAAAAFEAAERGRARSLLDLLREARVDLPQPAAPQRVRLADVQRHSLDEGTLLLAIFLGEERGVLWAVTPTAIHSFELPARERVEAVARDVYTRLSRLDPAARARQGTALAELGRTLFGRAAPLLSGKRLAVIADGALQYIPFAALPVPGDGAAGEPLIARHEVVVLPSVAVLAELRGRTAARPAATPRIAVLADPVFRQDDLRVAKGTRSPGEPARFERLPWTRREAEAIAAEVRPGSGAELLLALDFKASRDLAMSRELGRARIVHFATHGVLDSRRPERSGLVLSLVDAAGRPRDGFLRLRDIYRLNLRADLVVLSGCRTALGREIRGEGLIGLTRGFLDAGAPRVVASLWSVQDRATAELMGRFYHALLREGRPPAAALRTAQLALRQDRRFADPYFWAAFTFQGDW
jgi:CHAT domain-containing protein